MAGLRSDVCHASSSPLVSEVWGDFLPEASAKSAGLLCRHCCLTAPTAGPGDREDSAPRKVSMGEGRWPSEMLICGSDLAALGVGGTDKWQAELTASMNSALKKRVRAIAVIPSRQGGQGSNKGILSAYSGPEFF